MSRSATRRCSASCAPTTASRARSPDGAGGRRAPAGSGTRASTAGRSTPAPTSCSPRSATEAGNVGITPAVLEVGADIPGRPGLTVRGIAGQPPLRPVTAGGRVEFRVDARGASYRWRVRRVGEPAIRKRGEETDSRLVFRAPEGRVGRVPARAAFRPLARDGPVPGPGTERARLLVVVPAVSWLGTDKVDDPPFDGLPNSLADGGSVRWPRVFNGEHGPAGRVRRRCRAAAGVPRPAAGSTTT